MRGNQYTPVSGPLAFDPAIKAQLLPFALPTAAPHPPIILYLNIMNLSNFTTQKVWSPLSRTEFTLASAIAPAHPMELFSIVCDAAMLFSQKLLLGIVLGTLLMCSVLTAVACGVPQWAIETDGSFFIWKYGLVMRCLVIKELSGNLVLCDYCTWIVVNLDNCCAEACYLAL